MAVRTDDGEEMSAENIPLNDNFDARAWAEEFVRIKVDATDVEWMHAWFAAAIMCGYDHAMRRRDLALADSTESATEGKCTCPLSHNLEFKAEIVVLREALQQIVAPTNLEPSYALDLCINIASAVLDLAPKPAEGEGEL